METESKPLNTEFCKKSHNGLIHQEYENILYTMFSTKTNWRVTEVSFNGPGHNMEGVKSGVGGIKDHSKTVVVYWCWCPLHGLAFLDF